MRKAVNVPLGVAGSLNDPDDAERVLRDYGIDFADLGRVLMADPEYPKKVMEGRPEDVRVCVRCCECIHALIENHSAIECTVNFEMGREGRYIITPAEKPKKVLVIGGGPAGMEAARVAALRGHKVTLCEKEDRLGGNMYAASVPDFKVEYRWLIDWYSRQLHKAGVDVQLGKEFTPEDAQKMESDVLIVATGAEPTVPDDISGANKAVTATDVLLGEASVGRKVVILGGGAVGAETALHLAQDDKEVMIVEMLDDIALDVDLVVNRKWLLEKLKEAGVTWITNTKITEVGDTGIRGINMSTGKTVSYQADNVVLALGLKPVAHLPEVVKERFPEVYLIGDRAKARKVKEAIWDGASIARQI
jgi:2-enoate reductase